MQSPVNKNIDNYKDDFFKGMSLKQTAMCALTLGVGVGGFFLFYLVFKIPQTVSLYLVFPIALPFALAGFVKMDDGSLLTYLKRRQEVIRMPVYRYRPLVFDLLEENQITECETPKSRQKVTKTEEPELEIPAEDLYDSTSGFYLRHD